MVIYGYMAIPQKGYLILDHGIFARHLEEYVLCLFTRSMKSHEILREGRLRLLCPEESTPRSHQIGYPHGILYYFLQKHHFVQPLSNPIPTITSDVSLTTITYSNH